MATSRAEQAKVDVLTAELALLNELIATAKPGEAQGVLTDRKLLIAKINRLYGTDHLK